MFRFADLFNIKAVLDPIPIEKRANVIFSNEPRDPLTAVHDGNALIVLGSLNNHFAKLLLQVT